MGMTAKAINTLNQLWKSIPALRGGSEPKNFRLGDLLGPMNDAVIAITGVTLAAAATTAVTVADAKVGDVAVFILTSAEGAAVIGGTCAVTAGTVTITPKDAAGSHTPGNANAVGVLIVMRAVTSQVAGHTENPGA